MTQELNAERILLTKIIQASGGEYGDIEEEIQKLIGEPAHKIVLGAMEEYAKRYATACVKASQEWVSVEERLPEVDVPVITYPYSMMIIRHMKMDGDDKVWFFEALPVTHWKPLPEDPTT